MNFARADIRAATARRTATTTALRAEAARLTRVAAELGVELAALECRDVADYLPPATRPIWRAP